MRKIAIILILIFVGLSLPAQNPTPDDRLIDAVIQINAGNYDKATLSLNAIHAADSTNDAAVYFLSVCELAAGRTETAKEMLRKAVALDSSNVWYRECLANLLLATKSYVEAVDYIAPLIDEDPAQFNNPQMLVLVGDVRLQQRLPDMAVEYYSRALVLDPSFAMADRGLAWAEYVNGNYPAFFQALDRYVANETETPDEKVRLVATITRSISGQFYQMWGDKLNRVVDTIVTLHPESFEAQELRMNFSYLEGDIAGVVSCCDKMAGIAFARGDMQQVAQVLSTLGDIYYQDGDEVTSFKMYRQALKYWPDYAPALNNYAYHLSVKGKSLRKALKMVVKATEIDPDNASYLDTHAWILHQLGRDEEAKAIFKRAMIYGGRDSKTVLEHYSEVLRALGENGLADYYLNLSESKE